MKRFVGTSAGFLGLTLLALSLAPGTAAAEPVVMLPATDSIYFLTCDDAEFNGILYELDGTTGEASQVGSWVNPDRDTFECAASAAYNPANGKGYWLSWGTSGQKLIEVDLMTGANRLVGDFLLDGVAADLIALAIDGAGNGWATTRGAGGLSYLYSVNLATAGVQVVGLTGVTFVDQNYGLAWDSVTDTVYGYNPIHTDFYTVNTATGVFTVFNDMVFPADQPYEMAFDSSGRVWGFAGNNSDAISALLSDLDTLESLAIDIPYSEAVMIATEPTAEPALTPTPALTPAPELAATGLANSSALFVAGAGMLLLGAGLVIARRRKVA